MKIGLWGGRADRRGLAIQTGEFARHMRPDRVMGFDLTAEDRSPYECDWKDYDGLDLTVAQPSKLTRADAMRWLDGLDVVYAAETFYLDDLPLWADELGVATVCQVNPEFYRWASEDIPKPTLTVAPTRWRLDRMPGVELLPFPVDRQRCRFVRRPSDGPVTFLHVAGHPAMHDRNGTSSLLRALQHLTVPSRLIIRSQADVSRRLKRRQAHDVVDIKVLVEDIPDYWRLYEGADVLVLPRRYGGQSLPVNEAMSCGMPVITSDVAPQREWVPPATRVQARVRTRLATQAGTVDVHDVNPVELAATMDRLASDRELVARLSEVSDRRAETISWETLEPTYRRMLVRAVDLQGAVI